MTYAFTLSLLNHKVVEMRDPFAIAGALAHFIYRCYFYYILSLIFSWHRIAACLLMHR